MINGRKIEWVTVIKGGKLFDLTFKGCKFITYKKLRGPNKENIL